MGGDFFALYFFALYENDSVLATNYVDFNVTNGFSYRYIWRARNVNGWSGFSPAAYLIAASVPPQPQMPLLLSIDDSTLIVTINLPSPQYNGGSDIIDHQLYIDQGDINTSFVLVSNIAGSSGTTTLPISGQTLTKGKIYSVRWTIRSIIGTSQPSEVLRFGYGASANSPTNLSIDLSNSGPGIISLNWNKATDGDLKIIGYVLQMQLDSYTTIYDGRNDPDTTSYIISGLTPGKYYQFRVMSYNFNGPSLSYSTFGTYACGILSGFSTPQLVSSTSSSITIKWDEPSNNGGWTILDYRVYRDLDGTATTWTEVNPSPTYTGNDPFNRQFICTTFPVGAVPGDSFSFYIKAITIQTYLQSSSSPAFLLADVPSTPTIAPTVVPDLTNGIQIGVAYEAISSDGGSSITSYELQKGSTSLTDFVTISGAEPKSLALSFTVTLNVSKGKYYSFRYRAVNSVGASDWSPISIIQAATVPPAPPAPVYSTADTSSVTLSFSTPTDNGGSQILNYYLYRDTGVKTSSINQLVSGYTGQSEYQVTGLSSNTVYRFALVVSNVYGNSAQSMAVSVQTSTTPLQIPAPTVDWTYSSKTSLYIKWTAVSDPTATILGYILSMDDGMGGSFSDIFEGVFEPSIFNYYVTGLTTGLQYRFKVRAAGYNDQGPDSNIASFYACTSPSGFQSPTLVQSTTTTIQIQWNAPTDDGGCSLTSYAVFRDDGNSGTITTEVNTSNDPAIRGDPSLSGVTITNFSTGTEGSAFRIKVTAFNSGGRQADSGIQTFILASIPDTPTDAPLGDSSITSASVIKVHSICTYHLRPCIHSY